VSVCCCVLLPVPPGASGSPGKGWVACCSSWLWRGARDSCALDVMGGHLSRGDGLSSACGSFFATNACACNASAPPSHTSIIHAACLLLCLSPDSALTTIMPTPAQVTTRGLDGMPRQ
jgi:hypothetical protein